MDASPTSADSKRRATRKAVPKLPLAQAHALDVVKAAKLGIDISFMAAGERCQYPSKFCCNIRARKSTGKLHRFCEDHRVRAKVNQKRWIEARRKGIEHTNEELEAALALLNEDGDLDWVDEALSSTLSDLHWTATGSPKNEATSDPDFDDDEIWFLLSTILADSPDWGSGDINFSAQSDLFVDADETGMFNL